MKEELLSTLENSKNYTLSVAEAMPKDAYDFKPVDTVWSFRELLDHIAYGIGWWESNYVKGTEMPWAPPGPRTNKEEVKKYLEEAYASLKKTIDKPKLNDNEVKGFHSTLDHITHHRGQAITYLRCKGITAPEYTY